MKIKNRLDKLELLAIVGHSPARYPFSRATKIRGTALGLITLALGATLQLRGEDKHRDNAKGDQSVSIQPRIIEAPAGTMGQLIQGDAPDPNVPAVISKEQTDDIMKRLSTMKSVNIMTAPYVTTLSGKEATVQSGSEVVLDPENLRKNEFVGISITMLPTVVDKDIDMKIMASVSEETGVSGERPLIKSLKVDSPAIIRAGSSVMLRQEGGTKNGEKKEIIFLITPKIGAGEIPLRQNRP